MKIAQNLVATESRSRQKVILGPREECCDKRQDAETEKKTSKKDLITTSFYMSRH